MLRDRKDKLNMEALANISGGAGEDWNETVRRIRKSSRKSRNWFR